MVPPVREPATTAAAASHVSRHLISVSSAVRIFARKALERRGHLPSAAITLVATNLPAEGLGMSALAQRAGLSLQRAGQLVTELEEAGYVQRVADPEDGRVRRAVYTARGRRLLRDIAAINSISSGNTKASSTPGSRLGKLRPSASALRSIAHKRACPI